jgi:hypothetical protein
MTVTTDALGRRRLPTQHRGLRPLFPKLPANFETRLLRVAMSSDAWQRLDALVAAADAATKPRAVGAVVEELLDRTSVARRRLQHQPPFSPSRTQWDRMDWLAWQLEKEQRLLSVH